MASSVALASIIPLSLRIRSVFSAERKYGQFVFLRRILGSIDWKNTLLLGGGYTSRQLILLGEKNTKRGRENKEEGKEKGYKVKEKENMGSKKGKVNPK
jgi:hypothetical protein